MPRLSTNWRMGSPKKTRSYWTISSLCLRLRCRAPSENTGTEATRVVSSADTTSSRSEPTHPHSTVFTFLHLVVCRITSVNNCLIAPHICRLSCLDMFGRRSRRWWTRSLGSATPTARRRYRTRTTTTTTSACSFMVTADTISSSCFDCFYYRFHFLGSSQLEVIVHLTLTGNLWAAFYLTVLFS